jgi:hypothetical protein
MGFLDKAKDAISENSDKLDGAIDKAVDIADEKSGGKLGDKGDVIADKAKDALKNL